MKRASWVAGVIKHYARRQELSAMPNCLQALANRLRIASQVASGSKLKNSLHGHST
jgi:hypothetical protein